MRLMKKLNVAIEQNSNKALRMTYICEEESQKYVEH